MKRVLAAIIFSSLFAACSSSTAIVQERMVISPQRIAFDPPASSKLISITHTCTCPFSWNATVDSARAWFTIPQNFPVTKQGDDSFIPLSIDRTKLTANDSVVVRIKSNSYGTDTIMVVAIK
jgi:hypothetical protein